MYSNKVVVLVVIIILVILVFWVLCNKSSETSGETDVVRYGDDEECEVTPTPPPNTLTYPCMTDPCTGETCTPVFESVYRSCGTADISLTAAVCDTSNLSNGDIYEHVINLVVAGTEVTGWSIDAAPGHTETFPAGSVGTAQTSGTNVTISYESVMGISELEHPIPTAQFLITINYACPLGNAQSQQFFHSIPFCGGTDSIRTVELVESVIVSHCTHPGRVPIYYDSEGNVVTATDAPTDPALLAPADFDPNRGPIVVKQCYEYQEYVTLMDNHNWVGLDNVVRLNRFGANIRMQTTLVNGTVINWEQAAQAGNPQQMSAWGDTLAPLIGGGVQFSLGGNTATYFGPPPARFPGTNLVDPAFIGQGLIQRSCDPGLLVATTEVLFDDGSGTATLPTGSVQTHPAPQQTSVVQYQACEVSTRPDLAPEYLVLPDLTAAPFYEPIETCLVPTTCPV